MSTSEHRILEAAENCDVVELTKLLDAGFEIDSLIEQEMRSEGGVKFTVSQTVLMCGVKHVDVVKLLLARGGNPDVKSAIGRTALRYCQILCMTL